MDPWDDGRVHADELVEARDLLRLEGMEAVLLEPMGDPALMIERMAEDGGYDTIVIGTRDLGAVDRLLMGSVAERVVRLAPCPVLTMRTDAAEVTVPETAVAIAAA